MMGVSIEMMFPLSVTQYRIELLPLPTVKACGQASGASEWDAAEVFAPVELAADCWPFRNGTSTTMRASESSEWAANFMTSLLIAENSFFYCRARRGHL